MKDATEEPQQAANKILEFLKQHPKPMTAIEIANGIDVPFAALMKALAMYQGNDILVQYDSATYDPHKGPICQLKANVTGAQPQQQPLPTIQPVPVGPHAPGQVEQVMEQEPTMYDAIISIESLRLMWDGFLLSEGKIIYDDTEAFRMAMKVDSLLRELVVRLLAKNDISYGDIAGAIQNIQEQQAG